VSGIEPGAAIRALQLQDIYFRDEHVVVHPQLVPAFARVEMTAQFRISTRLVREFEGMLDPASGDARPQRFCEIEFVGEVRCLGHATDEATEDELLGASVTVALLYVRHEECSDAFLQEFTRVNAPYHAIPYWREHLHAVCAKRRFPAITVPMYSVIAGSGLSPDQPD
jgi:hypothetical protein